MKWSLVYLLLIVLSAKYTLCFYFYIYEWPEDIIDAWPDQNITLSNGPKGHGVIHMYATHAWKENNGFGKLIDASIGLYDTYQFALFKVIYARLKRHPLRTFDRVKADIFFIPIDVGFNGVICKETGRDISKVWTGCDLSFAGNGYLRNETEFKRLYGHDHFLIFDLSNAHFLMDPCYEFLANCINCTVLGIETLLYNTPFTKWIATEQGYENHRLEKRWQGVPFPAAVHWTDTMNRSSPPWAVNRWKREILSIYWGNSQLYVKTHIALRNEINSQCMKAALQNSTACWSVLGDSRIFQRNMYNSANLLHYTKPAGDAETRKGIFDALLLGCIPVVFSPQVLHRVYGWHFNRTVSEAVTVYIPRDDVVSGNVSFIDILRRLTPAQILEKQRAIEAIAPSIQYGLPPSQPPGDREWRPWSPPADDAVDVILKKLHEKVSYYKRYGRIPDEDKYVPKNFHTAIYGDI